MKRVILVGFMGSGKSSLGKKLANRMNIPFLDSDTEIEKHAKKSIGEIFGEHGESYFRTLEMNYIQSLRAQDEFVLATGGGMPCFDTNMDLLNELGTTFYLERSPRELNSRLSEAKKQRPLIEGMTDGDRLNYIEEKLSQREEFYKQAAFVLSREEQTVDAIAELIHLLQPHQTS